MSPQAKELLDHLEDVLSNKPVEVISGNTIVEAKPQVNGEGGEGQGGGACTAAHCSTLATAPTRSSSGTHKTMPHALYGPQLTS